MICKACGQNKKLIDAHIIPKSFYMNLRSDSNHLDLLSSSSPKKTGRSFKGEYDKNILCKDCDSKFEIYDDYAKKLLIDCFAKFKEIKIDGRVQAWRMDDFDFNKIKMFFLSVLWRASISKRPFFRRVKLGPHENTIKQILLNGNKDSNNIYTIALSKFIPNHDSTIEKTIIDPDLFKMNGINYYRIYLAGYTAWVKIDKRKSCSTMNKIELNHNHGFIISRDFFESKEFGILKKIFIAKRQQ